MSESPTEYSGQKMKSNETKYLTPYFTTNSVKVMREEEEYPQRDCQAGADQLLEQAEAEAREEEGGGREDGGAEHLLVHHELHIVHIPRDGRLLQGDDMGNRTNR